MKNLTFSLLIQEHKKFGQMLQSFLLTDVGNENFTIVDRLALEKIRSYSDHLNEDETRIVKIIENYSDKSLARRFNNKKLSPRDFIHKVEPEYVERFIRPFIEKNMAQCISLARKNHIPVFYRETKDVVYKSDQVNIEETPAQIVFNFKKLPDETQYFQTLSHNGKTMKLKDSEGLILTNDPCWLMLDQRLYHFREEVDGKKVKLFFNKEFIQVPEKHEKKYYSTFVKNCIRDFPVHTEGIDIRTNSMEKVPLLKLEIDFSGLPGIFLYLKYGSEICKHTDVHQRLVSYQPKNGIPGFEITERDLNWEQSIVDLLISLGLKKSFENVFLVKDQQDQYNLVNWINTNIKTLKQHRFELEQHLSDKVYYTGSMEITVSFEDKNDWFDVYAIAKFGNDFEIPVINLRKYLLNGIREYVLPNGNIAILPEEWFSKYADLLTFGTKIKDRIKISKPHAGMIQDSMRQTMTLERKSLKDIATKSLKEQIDLPESVKATLRSYQIEGFRWLNFLRKHKLGGCLADDMGLGKTLQTLALLAKHLEASKPVKSKKSPLKKGQLDIFEAIEKMDTSWNPSLVIMPASLIHNWMDEITKFVPHISHINYTGAQRHELFDKIPKAQLVLTTYGTIRNDHEILKPILFDYIILDESQIIKNPASKTAKAIFKLDAKYRLALSGTPIENSLSDLWSQMNFLNPGLLRDHKFYKNYFANPIEKNNDDAKQEKLQNLIKPFILRRTKAEVEKELPRLSEEYVYCEMTEEQKDIYNSEKIAIRNLILESFEKDLRSETAFAMVQALTKLRQLANHPVMMDTKYNHGSGKFDEVIRNLETLISEGHKVLVFSSFVKHLNIFTQYFDDHKLKYSLLTGQSRQRANIIKQFQTDPERNVFFISLKAGGVGLNLTEAEYVFILDPWWNPQAENQAINRAHRIGQTKPVIAYRFISMNSIEEKILKLQRKKSKLAELFIKSDNPLKDINVDTIHELIG